MRNLLPLIIILLAIAFLLRVDFVFYILYVCLGLYLLSRWLPERRLRKTEVTRRFTDHAFWGETIDVEIAVENRSKLPIPWITIEESVAIELSVNEPIQTVFELGGRESISFLYKIHARRRGYYRIGPARLTTGDLFGFGPERILSLPVAYLTVYPRITPFHRLGLRSRLPFGTVASREQLFKDPARPVGVRPFRSGYSVRQVNWKVSAHTRDLMVKTLQPAISLETILILNLNRGDYTSWNRHSLVEWNIELAASLAAYLITQKQAVGLLSNGIDPLGAAGSEESPQFDQHSGRLIRSEEGDAIGMPPLLPKRGRPHLVKLLERLARIEPSDEKPFNEWLVGRSIPISWGGTAIVLSPTGDLALCQTLHQMVKRGINPLLLITEPGQQMGQLQDRAKRLGFQAAPAAKPADLVTGLG